MTKTLVTEEQLLSCLPKQFKKTVNKSLLNQINTRISNVEEHEHFRENLLSYTSVLTEGKFKMGNYISAVRYVSLKLSGLTNLDAYIRTFPAKYQGFLAKGVVSKDIASYVTAYNKSKLVNLIYEQTLIPTHILNADIYQKAINMQAELMTTANSEKVRSDAANSLLTHLKAPEVKRVELDMSIKQDKSIDELRATTLELAAQQRMMIQAGAMDAKEVAHSKFVVIDHEED